MKLKNVLFALICLFAFSLSMQAQVTAYRIIVYGSLPAYCNPLNGDVVILSTNGQAYQCTGSGTWGSLGLSNTQTLTSNQGTLTGASTPFIGHSVTWNNAGTTFTDDFRNITITAATYPSYFANWWVGGAPVFQIDSNGDITNTQPSQTASNPWLTHTSTWNAGGVTFVDDFRNITSTASAAGSLLAQWQVGSANVFTVSKAGIVTAGGFADNSECFSGAQPAVCAAATSGMAAIANGTASTIVDTSAVTANSVIHVVQDNSIGAKISQTCTATGIPLMVTARTPGTSFTVSTSTGGNVAANYECFTFTIRN
jgi:hypothetical protein